jgi:hypothetical protein
VDGWGVISWGCYDPVFEIKFYITISRFEIAVFEITVFDITVFEVKPFYRT